MSNPRDKMEALVRWVMRDVTYHKHYIATVQRQSGATVDLICDDPSMRGSGLSGVPIDTIPGVDATVPPGAEVTLYFANGDRTQPRARWVSGSPIELKLANGMLPVARVGDSVVINPTGLFAGAIPVTGTCIGTITAGAPLVKA